jgi:hypothetical protein
MQLGGSGWVISTGESGGGGSADRDEREMVWHESEVALKHFWGKFFHEWKGLDM